MSVSESVLVSVNDLPTPSPTEVHAIFHKNMSNNRLAEHRLTLLLTCRCPLLNDLPTPSPTEVDNCNIMKQLRGSLVNI